MLIQIEAAPVAGPFAQIGDQRWEVTEARCPPQAFNRMSSIRVGGVDANELVLLLAFGEHVQMLDYEYARHGATLPQS